MMDYDLENEDEDNINDIFNLPQQTQTISKTINILEKKPLVKISEK